MDTRSKVLFIVAAVLAALSVASLFYKIVVIKDFVVVEPEEEVEELPEGE